MWGNFGDEAPLLVPGRPAPSTRKWQLAAGASTLVALALALALAFVASERSALLAAARPSSLALAAEALASEPGQDSSCTAAGMDIYATGKELDCCDGLTTLEKPCFAPSGLSVCNFCVPLSQAAHDCTPAGSDVFANPKGVHLSCCPGFVEVAGPCRGTDQCMFCQPSSAVPGPRATYPQPVVSIDPLTPKEAVERHYKEGMSLILSDEFKDMARTKSIFVFEDIPYGVPGNTGDVNIASVYASDTISLLPEGGLRLGCYMAPEDEKVFMQGWNGTWNTNWGSDVSKWTWHAPKVTSRLNGRFQYGWVETSIKAPKGYGNWPAAWLNGCYGFISEASGEFLLQDDYPFLCGQYWPPELDFFEHFSPEHTWYWRPNSMSLHSPNQYVGLGQKLTAQGGFCPTTLAPPGEAWCFGVSGAGSFKDDPTERFIDYGMRWDPDGVDYYMDGEFMHRFTRDQLVLYLSGQLRPVLIPEMPLFLTFNIALVRKGMDLSHGGEGLTDKANYDRDTGKWKVMAMDIKYIRVYQDDTQGETRGLNPPITYETRRKLLANRVTCNLIPELRCLVKVGGGKAGVDVMAQVACDKLKSLGDDYCATIPHLCSLNNAGNPGGVYGLSNATIANMANQHLSLVHGICCIEQSKELDKLTGAPLDETATCRETPKTKLPTWLRESEYFKDPPMVRANHQPGSARSARGGRPPPPVACSGPVGSGNPTSLAHGARGRERRARRRASLCVPTRPPHTGSAATCAPRAARHRQRGTPRRRRCLRMRTNKARTSSVQGGPLCPDEPRCADASLSLPPRAPAQGVEGAAGGLAGTNPAGWKTYGRGLPPPPPPAAA